MKQKSILLAAILAAFVFVLSSNVNAQSFAVGSTLEGFKLTDTNGKEQSFDSLKGEKGTVLVFLSAQCPVVRGYNARLGQIAADYQAKGINFIGINSNATETLEMIKANAAENYKFPVLIDKDNILADKIGANVTPGPVVAADGTIYSATNAGVLHALDPATGADRWTYDGGGGYGGEVRTSGCGGD